MQQWYGQLGQDRFVWLALAGKRRGTFADIGAGEPEHISNTVALERDFGWHGILCDIDFASRLRRERSKRNRVFGDAFRVDWAQEFKRLATGGWIDYLSLDLEPPETTIRLFLRLPLDRVRFRIATVEHDFYRDANGQARADVVHSVMRWHGYELVVEAFVRDISGSERTGYLEDWYVHREAGIDVRRLREDFGALQLSMPVSNH